jgi:hypothetical protein
MPNIYDYPVPQAREADEIDDGLYNSDRSFFSQLMSYKDYQGKVD